MKSLQSIETFKLVKKYIRAHMHSGGNYKEIIQVTFMVRHKKYNQRIREDGDW
jgi:hypothetical protein